jgi:hypothetical protein
VYLVGLHELGALVAVVELVWGSIRVPALGDDQDVRGTTERIREDSNRSEVDIGVVPWSLASRATVEVPLWEVFNLELTIFWDLGESLPSKSSISMRGLLLSASCELGGNFSPLTLIEYHQWSRSRCTFCANQ